MKPKSSRLRSDLKEHLRDVTLPEKYCDFSDVMDKAKANKLPAHSPHELAIELVEGNQSPFALIL